MSLLVLPFKHCLPEKWQEEGLKSGGEVRLCSLPLGVNNCVPSPQSINKVDFGRDKAFILFIQDYLANAIAYDF